MSHYFRDVAFYSFLKYKDKKGDFLNFWTTLSRASWRENEINPDGACNIKGSAKSQQKSKKKPWEAE